MATSKMSALMDLVSQAQPHFQTHQALLVIGLQNDFILPGGRLPVTSDPGFLDRIQTLVPKFRELNGIVIWAKTVYEVDRIANDTSTGEGDALVLGGLVDDALSIDGVAVGTGEEQEPSPRARRKQRALDLLKRVGARKKVVPVPIAKEEVEEDEELFLLKGVKRAPACVPGTPGAEFTDIARAMKGARDNVITTSNYSAFQGTNLLMTLRAKIVTELFICGCLTNVSVLATVIDAARHGIKINVVEDCLGWRKTARHDLALKRMADFFDAWVVKSEDILAREPQIPQTTKHGEKSIGKELEAVVGTMSLNDRTQNGEPQAYDKSATPNEELSDEQFAAMLTSGVKNSRGDQGEEGEEKEETKLVTTKIRMRSKAKKKAKKKVEALKEGTAVPGENQGSADRKSTKNTPDQTSQEALPVAVAEGSQSSTNQNASQSATSGSTLRLPLSDTTSNEVVASGSILPSAPQSKNESKETLNSTDATSTKQPSTPRKVDDPSNTPFTTTPVTSTNMNQEEVTNDLRTPPTLSSSTKTSKMGKFSKLKSLANFPVLGPGDHIAEGDSRIIHDFFPPSLYHPTNLFTPLRDLIFAHLYNEVRWQKMMHQQGEVPRLVCCQGEFGLDGSMPVYRHPSDQSLPLLHFSPKVQVIRKRAEKLVGHPLNHVLIQLYRGGQDFISEHSDKTLDIVKGSSIVNVSFGAKRTMRLRTKKSSNAEEGQERETQRVHLPHNSLFVLGLESNAKWLHGIMADKRLPSERSDSELEYNGIRISLTFRHIGTFLDAKESVIWGQGATSQAQADAADVINGNEKEAERMIRAFSKENHSKDFDWNGSYGEGFDVLHLQAPPPDLPILFASRTATETKQIQLGLWEAKIPFTLIDAPELDQEFEASRAMTFRDNDAHHTEVSLPIPILLYLDRYHPLDSSPNSRSCTAAAHPILTLSSKLSDDYRMGKDGLVQALAILEDTFSTNGGPFIAGKRFSIADCYVWPVVDELVENWEGWSKEVYPQLSLYYGDVWRRKASVKRCREVLGDVKEKATVGGEL